MAEQATRGTGACPMRPLRKAVSRAVMANGAVARTRRDVLAAAALELAEERGDSDLEAVLRIAVEAAARITGSAAALVLARDGRLDRFAARGVDGRAHDTLA